MRQEDFLSANLFIINFRPWWFLIQQRVGDDLTPETPLSSASYYRNVLLIFNLRVKKCYTLWHHISFKILLNTVAPHFITTQKHFFSRLSRIITSSNINPNEIVNRFFSYYECMITFSFTIFCVYRSPFIH